VTLAVAGASPTTTGAGGGQGATAAAPTAAATATGSVSAVSDVADASSGVASFTVTVTFADPSGQFVVGTGVTASITTGTRAAVVEVPALAVTSTNGTSSVLVSTDGTATATERRTVTTGASAGGMVEITSGLQAGEQVVVELPSFAGAGRSTAATGGTGRFGGEVGGEGRRGPTGAP
jgi:multidrug efflux pump subunit AcrA (membrane-fusion protein)